MYLPERVDRLTGTGAAAFFLAGAFFLVGAFLAFFLPEWHLLSPVLKQQLVINSI
jgi:hypothetical protein